jgi:hypothetical protein
LHIILYIILYYTQIMCSPTANYIIFIVLCIILYCIICKLSILIKYFLCLTKWALSHEDVWRSGYIDWGFLDFRTEWRRVVNFTLLPLKRRGKELPYPLCRRLGGPQSRYTRKRDISWHSRDSKSDRSVVQPVESRYSNCSFFAPIILQVII